MQFSSFLFSLRLLRSMLTLLLLSSACTAAAFAPMSRSSMVTSSLGYRNHHDDDDEAADDNAAGAAGNDGAVRRGGRGTQLTMPVLGPWVEQPPLLPGCILELNDPTPMQYQSLQLAIDKQQEQQQQHLAVALATPVVAILDQYTVHQPDPGRYATLAAVLGYTEKKTKAATGTPLLSSSSAYFMDSIRSRPTRPHQPPPRLERSVRLLGIGRALLTNMCYESTKQNAMDADGYLLECEVIDHEDAAGMACDNAVIVGTVQIVRDQLGSSTTVAPVRAVAECAALLGQISYWHIERQRLVRQMAHEDTFYQDLDGIGSLFSFQQQQQHANDNDDYHLDRISTTPRSHLEQLDNYGLGGSASAISSLPDLTHSAIQALAPFYSPDCLATEDFYYQVGSWAALAALQCYVQPPHLAWAVRCTDTTERLTTLEHWMQSHVRLLRQCVVATTNKNKNNNNPPTR
jgi:hypothetical protein